MSLLHVGCSATIWQELPQFIREKTVPITMVDSSNPYQIFSACKGLLLTASDEGVRILLETAYPQLPCLYIGATTDAFFQEVRHRLHILQADSVNSLREQSLWQTFMEMANQYEKEMRAPFFKELYDYVEEKPISFATPGHDGGRFYEQHPAGAQFVYHFGKALFVGDVSSSDVAMGDPVIHEGPAYLAEKKAAEVFHADFTYFVLNGTSGANKTVCSALLQPGDYVLFDRNNHRSVYQGALTLMGATPIFLEAERNSRGMIGGIPDSCLREEYIRRELAAVSPEQAKKKRPFRLALLQHNTHDGLIYNVKEVIRRIGHLCEYILFDAAWLGYEQCLPMLQEYSPLLLDYGPDDPGIFVTQSVHKQLAGFSQTSQIHKKDSHIKGQKRYCHHHCFNNAFILLSSTSPCYPLFASVAVNAKMHEGPLAQELWQHTVKNVVDLRKQIAEKCRYFTPFQDNHYNDELWTAVDTETLASSMQAYTVEGDWHGFSECTSELYAVDPCKVTVTMPGVQLSDGQWLEEGIPATVVAQYLAEKGIVPEKSDMYAMLFLFTPSMTAEKGAHLVAQLMQFESDYEKNTLLSECMPKLAQLDVKRYKTWGLRDVCHAIHRYYKEHRVTDLLKKLFLASHFPKIAMNAQQANYAFNRGQWEEIPVSQATGRIAVEGALPYPPGIIVVNGGEVWTEEAVAYFSFLDELATQFPGFSSEVQGVHPKEVAGKQITYTYVLTNT